MPSYKDLTLDQNGNVTGTHGRSVYYVDDIHEDSDGFASVPLPSGRGAVQIRGMRGEEENLFGDDSSENVVYPIEECVRRCTKDGQSVVSEENFLLDDFLFLVLQVRRQTYGDIINFTMTCPKCRKDSPYKYDLSKVEILMASPQDREVYQDPLGTFQYTLPRSGVTLKYRAPWLALQRKNFNLMQTKRDKMITEALRQTVVKIVSGSPLGENLRLLEESWASLPAMDITAMNSEIGRHQVGVNTDIKAKCPKCRHESIISLPIRDMDFLASPGDTERRPDGRWSTFSASPTEASF